MDSAIDVILFLLIGSWFVIWAIILGKMWAARNKEVRGSRQKEFPKPHPTLYRIQFFLLVAFGILYAIRYLLPT